MNWWMRIFRRKRMDQQLDKELSFHLEQHERDLMERGYTPAEARRLARIELGGQAQVAEECREARGTRWLEDFLQDFRYALRSLRHNPGFAMVALLTLALGTGATTGMFTLINGVLLKPLPYPNPGQLLNLQEKTDWSTHWGDLWGFSYPNFLDCQNGVHSMDMAAYRFSGGTVSASGQAQYIDGYEVSSGLFPLLGIQPAQGRTFTADDDRPGAAPVAIIGQELWLSLFGGDPAAIGKTLVFEEKPYTIIGVAPAGFQLQEGLQLEGGVGIVTPLGQDTSRYMQNREGFHGLRVWARLHPGASRAQAQAELALIGSRLEKEFPKSNHGRTFIAEPLRPEVGDARSALWLLFGAVTVVLLIACVNIASLLLARAASREREMAMRVALGAGRGRLIRQCFAESGALGLAGSLVGILLAAAGLRPFIALWPGTLPRAQEVHLDWHVLLFALAVCIVSSLLFGLAPALRAPVRNVEEALRAGTRTIAGSSRRLHSSFVVSEIALAVVLLSAAGILAHTMLRLNSVDPGVNIHNVLVARVALPPTTLHDPGKSRTTWQQVLRDVAAVPGVESVATVDTVPLREGNNQVPYSTTKAPARDDPFALASSVTPDYLKVTGIALRSGRFFNDHDQLGTQGVVVIDDVMARQAFPGQDPIGKRLWTDIVSDPAVVVGVVDHVRYWGLAEDDQAKIRAQYYYPFAQVPDQFVGRWSELMSIAVRTRVEPLRLLPQLRQAVRGVTGDQVLYEVRTLEQLARGTLAQQRFLLSLFSVFAAIALLLACVGVYGVLAYLTSRRIPEIGVRIALGADARSVMWMVLRQSLAMIGGGSILGIVGGVAAGRLLQRLVPGVQAEGPFTYGVVVALLLAAALLASLVPAGRASRVDPMIALRQE
jgi:predicted permease